MGTRISDKNHKFLKRPCVRCDKMFSRSTKFSQTCDSCLKKYEEWRNGSGKRSLKDYEEYLKNEKINN